MCTSLSLPTSDGRRLCGRTLDLDTHFNERLLLTPKGYPFRFGEGYPQNHHHAMLGMGAVAEGYPLYAEAMNEAGLCVAGLRFTGNAVYAEHPRAGWLNLAPWELIPYLLGSFSTVREVRQALKEIQVVDRPLSPTLPTAPLHWHIADSDPHHGELVVEITREGMKVYDNPVGVLTNNPPFPYQLARLTETDGLSPAFVASAESLPGGVCASLGTGAVGLPGDYSSPSRFVRAARLRRWALDHGGAGNPVARFFDILGAVSPPAGSVLTLEGGSHRTLYTCCMDGGRGDYHYRTEEDPSVKTVSLIGGVCRGDKLLFLD